MAWDDGLLREQRSAAAHVGNHARLLAGPGTGKTLTLTRHVCFLVSQRDVSPDRILAVTFTRAAARELRQRVEAELGDANGARISTLHSFALRQLMRNARRMAHLLPQPLRMADDWEERHIILEDVKRSLCLGHINEARDLLSRLSADWQSLTADDVDWDRRFPNSQFLGTWREHRQVYGYTLQAELVYQLKKALEQQGDFQLEGPLAYLLVDEYQDLNRCDLAVVHQIASRGVELFVAGDDDQSIYGFRKAHPEGIRRFPCDYVGAQELCLELCKRCDRAILDLGVFVASLDPRRIEKTITAEPGRDDGEVAILRFPNQTVEAQGIARLCAHLIERHALRPDDALILLRSDHKGAFSRVIRKEIEGVHISVTRATDTAEPLNEDNGRAFLAFMRLAARREDSLAWRTLFQVWCRGVGQAAIDAVYDVARRSGRSFGEIVLAACQDASILSSRHRSRVTRGAHSVLDRQAQMFPSNSLKEHDTCDELMEVVRSAARSLIDDTDAREPILSQFHNSAQAFQATSIEDLVRATEVASDDIEQEIQEGAVNILTMHRAKGLTAQAVIIAAAEDQYLPGRAEGDALDDERRLLYVSLTRAKHHLFVTYCDRRTGRQRHTGRDSGEAARSLTRFLVDSPHTPQDGVRFIASLAEEKE